MRNMLELPVMGWTFVETLNCSSFFFHQKAKMHLMFDTFLRRNTIAAHVNEKRHAGPRNYGNQA